VASAIEEQGAATQEIARNVTQTTQASQEVAERIARVSDEANATGKRADHVGRISAEVADGIDRLREVLVRVVRTSTKEVNRRCAPRYGIDRAGTLTAAGSSHAVTIANVSEGGLMACGLPATITSGARVEVTISGVSGSFPAVVLATERGRAHGKFDLAPNASEQWRRECAQLTSGLAPLDRAA
jgi:methyl-accepting chemotaxis protein